MPSTMPSSWNPLFTGCFADTAGTSPTMSTYWSYSMRYLGFILDRIKKAQMMDGWIYWKSCGLACISIFSYDLTFARAAAVVSRVSLALAQSQLRLAPAHPRPSFGQRLCCTRGFHSTFFFFFACRPPFRQNWAKLWTSWQHPLVILTSTDSPWRGK